MQGLVAMSAQGKGGGSSFVWHTPKSRQKSARRRRREEQYIAKKNAAAEKWGKGKSFS